MDRRTELSDILNSIDGVKKAYFQPPQSVSLVYPCILYRLRAIESEHANDLPYTNRDCYQITIIDRNPDSKIRQWFMNQPLCRFDRFYTADNLNHWVFVLYY